MVHFSGNPVNQKKLKYLKETYNIKILEDCAHSIGAKIDEIKAGSCANSDCSIFSFHPVKHITTGEGGAITTNSKELYEKLLLLRGHGMTPRADIAPWHYDMIELGFNYRLTDISCALGLSQLKKLDSFLYLRRSIAKRYDDFFSKIDFIKPLYDFTNNSAYHLYVIKIDFEKLNIDKKEFVLKMRENNIGLQLHYIPINKQPYYKNLGFGNETTPVMDEYYKKAISLPIYPNFSIEEQEYVCKSIIEIFHDFKLLYSRLVDWYDNTQIYNLLGFILLAKGSKSMKLVSFVSYIYKDKKEFIKSLNKAKNNIIEYEKMEELEYGKNNTSIHNILLALSIFDDDNSSRFNFNAYSDKKQNWSLEHIFPQTPKLDNGLLNCNDIKSINELSNKLKLVRSESSVICQTVPVMLISVEAEFPIREAPSHFEPSFMSIVIRAPLLERISPFRSATELVISIVPLFVA